MISNDEFKKLVAKNLIYYRKLNGLTQLQLAEATFYSDKAISKWERGESLPEAYVLYLLADFYGINISDFFVKERLLNVSPTRKAKAFVSLIIFFAVWLLFAVIFVTMNVLSVPEFDGKEWLFFVYAIPFSFLAVYICSTAWFKDTPLPLLFISVAIWTAGAGIFLSLQQFPYGSFPQYAWLVFILLIFIQVIVALSSWLIRIRKQLNMSMFSWLRKSFQNFGEYVRDIFPSKKKKNKTKSDDSKQ